MTSPRVLLFARHGETEWNATGRWQGQTDVPLNERGRAQAEALGAWLRGQRVEAIASSDLSRARETGEIAGRAIGLTVSYVDAGFRERAYGIFEGLTRDECIALYPAEWERFERDPNHLPEGVETIDHLAERMMAGLRRVAALDERVWLIVSHGRAIRALASLVSNAVTAPLANGAAYRFVLERGEPVGASLVYSGE
jgi:probable phosphoglycerate mutase